MEVSAKVLPQMKLGLANGQMESPKFKSNSIIEKRGAHQNFLFLPSTS